MMAFGFAIILSSCENKEEKTSHEIVEDLSALQLVTRATNYIAEGKEELGIIDFKIAIQKDSLNPLLRHQLADVQMDYLHSRDALSTMQKAADDFPDHRLTLMKLSEFQLILEKHYEAKQTLLKVLEKHPQYDEAFFMLGMVAVDQKNVKVALTAFQKATELNGDNLDAWLMLGTIYSELDKEIALQCFDNAIAIDPQSWESMHSKAFYLQNHERISEAKAIYRNIISQNPQYEDAVFNLGILLLEQDSSQKALEHFRMTTKVNPQHAMAYYYEGLTWEKLNQSKNAIQAYEQALRLIPGFKRAKTALDFLKAKQ